MKWDDYQKAYQDAISETHTSYAPWFVVPADKKWYTHLAVSQIVLETLQDMNPAYPVFDKEQKKALNAARKMLGEKTQPKQPEETAAATTQAQNN